MEMPPSLHYNEEACPGAGLPHTLTKIWFMSNGSLAKWTGQAPLANIASAAGNAQERNFQSA